MGVRGGDKPQPLPTRAPRASRSLARGDCCQNLLKGFQSGGKQGTGDRESPGALLPSHPLMDSAAPLLF